MARRNHGANAKQKTTTAKKKQSSSKNNSKKNAPPREKRSSASNRFVVCPHTDQKVFIAQATLSDLKSPDTYRNNGRGASKKRLWTIPSLQHRQDHYRQVAKALALAEQERLPSSGGRSWEVEAKVTEPNGRVLFRAWKGKMELAVLPHLLDRIPQAPVWPGKRHQPKDEFCAFQDEVIDVEQDYIKALASREVSTLSHVAYDTLKKHPHNHPIPTITLKWISPDARSFLSRKGAWDHAQHLSEQEVAINRNLLGVGASGKLLQAFVPTLKATLEVLGPLRFVRDGLWVVGQELSWQDSREELIDRQKAEQAEKQSQRVYTTGLQLYVATHRVEYKNDEDNECGTLAQADRELRLLWHQMSSKEQQIWHDKVHGEGKESDDDGDEGEEDVDGTTSDREEQDGNESESQKEEEQEGEVDEEENAPVVLSRMKYFVFMRRDQYRLQRQKEMELEQAVGDTGQQQQQEQKRRRRRFTLGQADKELREQWKAMTEEEQDEWIDKLVNDPSSSSSEEKQDQDGGKEETMGESCQGAVDIPSRKASLVFDVEVAQGLSILKDTEEEYGVGGVVDTGVVAVDVPSRKASPLFDIEVAHGISRSKDTEDENGTGGVVDAGVIAVDVPSRKSSLVFDVEVAQGLSRPTDTEGENGSRGVVDTGLIVEGTLPTTATMSMEVAEDATTVILSNGDSNQNDEHSSDSGSSPMPVNTLLVEDTVEETNERNVVTPTKEDECQSETSSSSTPSNKEVAGTDTDSDDSTFFIVKPGGTRKIKTTSETVAIVGSTKKTSRIQKPTTRVTQRWCLNQRQIDQCHNACMEHYETVMRTVKTRDLLRELEDGFDVLRERGRGRFDMNLPAFDTPEFDFLNDFAKTPWMPVVHAILGDDVVLIHKGCFMSLPGAGSQEYHQDGVHLTTQTQRPCHAINVFVPLVDLTSRNGPTEFCLGSHVLGHEGYDRDFVEVPKPKAGTPVIFDYRLGHRGLANSSNACRPIVYCTYARAADGKEFRDLVNFSRKRYHKIGELAHKPMSREERSNKRKRRIESTREAQDIEDVRMATTLEIVRPTQQETDGTVPSEASHTETQAVFVMNDERDSSNTTTSTEE